MTKLLDRICELRDILEQKKYNELGRARMLCDSLFKELHLHMTRKSKDYSYELDFTSQDLRETAKAIGDTLKRWDDIMNPTKQIKKLSRNALLLKEEKKKVTILNNNMDEALPIMRYRRDYAPILTGLLSILEYHAVFLYFIEDVSNDEFSIKYTERGPPAPPMALEAKPTGIREKSTNWGACRA
jgi:hypothetical protein